MPSSEANKAFKTALEQMIAHQHEEIDKYKKSIDWLRTRLINYLETHDDLCEIIYETTQCHLQMIEYYKKIQYCYEYIASMYQDILENSSQGTEE